MISKKSLISGKKSKPMQKSDLLPGGPLKIAKYLGGDKNATPGYTEHSARGGSEYLRMTPKNTNIAKGYGVTGLLYKKSVWWWGV